MERMMMVIMMTNRPLKGGSDPTLLFCVPTSSAEAGDVRESRLGFGCQPVFSAIISSRVSRNVPADPAASFCLSASPGGRAKTHRSEQQLQHLRRTFH